MLSSPRSVTTSSRVIGSPRFARDPPSSRRPMSPMNLSSRTYEDRPPFSPRHAMDHHHSNSIAQESLSPDELEVEIQKMLKTANKRDQIPARPGWLYNSPCRFMPQCNQEQRCPFKHPTDLGKVMTRKDVLCRDGALCARTFCWFQHPDDSHTFVTRVSVLKERPAVRPKKKPPPVVPIETNGAATIAVTNGRAGSKGHQSPSGSEEKLRTNIAPEKPPGWLKSQIEPSDKSSAEPKKKSARRGRTRRGGRKNRRSSANTASNSTTPGGTTAMPEGGTPQSKDVTPTPKGVEDSCADPAADVTTPRQKKRGRRGGRGGRKKKQARKDKEASPEKEGPAVDPDLFNHKEKPTNNCINLTVATVK